MIGFELTWFEIVLSFFITWTVGLIPPLFTRYILLGRSMAKTPAISFAGIQWFLNLAFFTGVMGSESKSHFALVLISYASYYILTRRNGAKEVVV